MLFARCPALFFFPLIAEARIQNREALGSTRVHHRLRAARKELDEHAHVLHRGVVAQIVVDGLGVHHHVSVSGNLDATQLSEVEAENRRKRRVRMSVHLEALVLREVLRSSTIQLEQDVPHGANHSVHNIDWGHLTPRMVLWQLNVGAEACDVVVHVEVRLVLLVNPQEVVPRVGIAIVHLLQLNDRGAGNLDDSAIRTARHKAIHLAVANELNGSCRRLKSGRIGNAILLKRLGVNVLSLESLAAASANVEDLSKGVLAKLIRRLHDVRVFVVNQKESVSLRVVQNSRQGLTRQTGARKSLIKHLTVLLGRVRKARVVHTRAGRRGKEPLVAVEIDRHNSALEAALAAVAIKSDLLIVRVIHALGNAVCQRHHNVLALGSIEVENDTAALIIQRLECHHIVTLVCVVEQHHAALAVERLDLQSRPVVVLLQRRQQSLKSGRAARRGLRAHIIQKVLQRSMAGRRNLISSVIGNRDSLHL